MKTLVTNYTFAPSSKQITLTDYASLVLEGLLLITNVTSNIIIYNFANPALGASVTGNVITLDYDTVAMNANDKLQIYYDDISQVLATEQTLAAMEEQNVLMRRLLKLSESSSVVDINQRQRVALDTWGGTALASTTVLGRVILLDSASTMLYTLNGPAYATMVAVPDVWKLSDAARLNFQQCIRGNIQFTT